MQTIYKLKLSPKHRFRDQILICKSNGHSFNIKDMVCRRCPYRIYCYEEK